MGILDDKEEFVKKNLAWESEKASRLFFQYVLLHK